MDLTDADYNAFATAMVRRFADRLRGRDPGSDRFVGARPQDRVLAGYLTPVQPDETGGSEDPDDALSSDLPRDSSYEQTSVGAEWLTPTTQFVGDLQIVVGGAVYVRRIPKFEEQTQFGVWQTIPAAGGATARISELVPVWTREDFDPIAVTISLSDLASRRRLRVEIATDLSERLRSVEVSTLFPGRRQIRINGPQAASREAYDAFVVALPPGTLPVRWSLILDVRLVPFPSEPTLSRVAARVAEAIESRVKKEVLEVAPQHGELLVDMFNGGVDVTEMISAMQEIAEGQDTGDPQGRVRGLVTTNIIGHGVDVDRFNVMVFAGFTRLVAEYIQASARVGRMFPGLSILIITPQSERDRSIFDRFGKFHEYLDRLVDPSAVNRWPEPAVLRTIPGLLAGYLMGVAAAKAGKQLATVENVLDRLGLPGAEALNENAIVDWILAAYGAKLAPTPKYAERLTIRAKNAFSTVINTPRAQGKPRPLNTYLGAMRSLRDVDDPAFIEINDERDAKIVQVLTNG